MAGTDGNCQLVKTALDETRMLVLGAQILLGFELSGVFRDGFESLPTLLCPDRACLLLQLRPLLPYRSQHPRLGACPSISSLRLPGYLRQLITADAPKRPPGIVWLPGPAGGQRITDKEVSLFRVGGGEFALAASGDNSDSG
jgi:hypothetical protein